MSVFEKTSYIVDCWNCLSSICYGYLLETACWSNFDKYPYHRFYTEIWSETNNYSYSSLYTCRAVMSGNVCHMWGVINDSLFYFFCKIIHFCCCNSDTYQKGIVVFWKNMDIILITYPYLELWVYMISVQHTCMYIHNL